MLVMGFKGNKETAPRGPWKPQGNMTMKQVSTLLFLALLASSGWAQTYVKPHITKNGTLVEGHYRSNPNNTDLDNYSTKGNSNPFTGQEGKVKPSYEQPSFQMPKSQQCGYTATGRYVCN